MEERLSLTADRKESLEKLLQRHPGFSRRQISRLKFIPGGLAVNGHPVRATDPVLPGDRVSIHLYDRMGPHPESLPYRVLYEDQLLLVVDKPAGLVVHPSPGHESDSMQTVLESLLHHPLYLKGRLDKDTSGVLVFGKADWVPSLTPVTKRYLAICEGNPGHRQIDSLLLLRDRKMVPAASGKSAVTHVVPVKAAGQGTTLAAVTIEHGRMHQIRAHMSAIGHPLLGDRLYGNGREGERTLLHCAAAWITHPLTKEVLVITASLPEDFVRVLAYHPDRNDGSS